MAAGPCSSDPSEPCWRGGSCGAHSQNKSTAVFISGTHVFWLLWVAHTDCRERQADSQLPREDLRSKPWICPQRGENQGEGGRAMQTLWGSFLLNTSDLGPHPSLSPLGPAGLGSPHWVGP